MRNIPVEELEQFVTELLSKRNTSEDDSVVDQLQTLYATRIDAQTSTFAFVIGCIVGRYLGQHDGAIFENELEVQE